MFVWVMMLIVIVALGSLLIFAFVGSLWISRLDDHERRTRLGQPL